MLSRGPLTQRPYLLLVGGSTVSWLGNAMAPIALAFGVLDITHRSARDLGIVLAGRSVALVAFLLLGGVISDRLPRQAVLLGSSVLAGLSESATAALLLTGHARVPVLTALQVVNGASSAFTFPAVRALVAQTVPGDMLRQANVMMRMAVNATAIAGAALGGAVVALSGPGWGIAIDAATFFVAGAMYAGIRVPRLAAPAGKSMVRELAAGWRAFWGYTWLWVVVVQFAFINMALGAAFYVLGPLIASQRLGGASSWGVIVAAQGAGLILGGFVSAWRKDKRPLLAGNSAIALVVPLYALLAVAAPLPFIAAAAVLAGLGMEVFGVRWVTTMQEQIPGAMLSRMFAYDALGSFIFIPVGQILAGPAQRLLGTPGAIWCGAAIIGAAVIIVAFVPAIRAVRAGKVAEPEPSPVPA